MCMCMIYTCIYIYGLVQDRAMSDFPCIRSFLTSISKLKKKTYGCLLGALLSEGLLQKEVVVSAMQAASATIQAPPAAIQAPPAATQAPSAAIQAPSASIHALSAARQAPPAATQAPPAAIQAPLQLLL